MSVGGGWIGGGWTCDFCGAFARYGRTHHCTVVGSATATLRKFIVAQAGRIKWLIRALEKAR